MAIIVTLIVGYGINALVLFLISITPTTEHKIFATSAGVLIPSFIFISIYLFIHIITQFFNKHIDVTEDVPIFLFFFLVSVPIMMGIFSFSVAVAIEDWNYLEENCTPNDTKEISENIVASACVIRVTERGIIYAVHSEEVLNLKFRIHDSSIVINYHTLNGPPKTIDGVVGETAPVRFMKSVRDFPLSLFS